MAFSGFPDKVDFNARVKFKNSRDESFLTSAKKLTGNLTKQIQACNYEKERSLGEELN